MHRIHETTVTPLHVRSKSLGTETIQPAAEETPPSQIDWTSAKRKHPGESLLKNLAVAAALVLCVVTLRTGAIPSLSDATDAVLTAATDQSLLDDQLGKLSFVSSLFPEAVLVFGESNADFAMPVSGGVVVHAWSEAEPYMSWRTNQSQVTSASDGEVIGVYHGNGDERLVQVVGNDGVACLYGNLAEIAVKTGDWVSAGDILGEVMAGEDLVFEVRQDGISVDPGLYIGK